MNASDVRAAVDQIRRAEVRQDPERAHGDQDDLYVAVLTAISEGCDDPAELAAIALTVRDIEFPRWYA